MNSINLTGEKIHEFYIKNTIIYLVTTNYHLYLGNLVDPETEVTCTGASKYATQEFWVSEIIPYGDDCGTNLFILPQDTDY